MKVLMYVHPLLSSCKLYSIGFIIAEVHAELALQTGSSTLFSSQTLPNAVVAESPFAGNISRRFPGDNTTVTTGISDIMVDALVFARLINSGENENKSRLDPLTPMEILLFLLYSLVEMKPFGHSEAEHVCTTVSVNHEIAHLGMLAFMTTFIPEYGRAHDRSSYPLLHKHLERAIGDMVFIDSVYELNDSAPFLILWTILMNEIIFWKHKERAEMLTLIVEISRRLDLRDWAAVCQESCLLPWIHFVDDAPGYRL